MTFRPLNDVLTEALADPEVKAEWDRAGHGDVLAAELITPTNDEELDLIVGEYEAWKNRRMADRLWLQTGMQDAYVCGWTGGFDSGIECAKFDLELAESAEQLARAFRGAVMFAWRQMHEARAAVAEDRKNGVGTLRSMRMADNQEIALRTLLLVRKLARSGWTGE